MDTTAEMLGSAAVAAMAELEGFMRDLVDSITRDINDRHIPVRLLRPEVRVLHAHSTFESVRTLAPKNDKFWTRRKEIARLHMSDDVASLPARSEKGPQPPLRGTTIALRDIYEVATTFGFRESSRLQGNGKIIAALKKLSSYRNTYAHGSVPPAEIFSDPTSEIANVIEYIGHVCDLLDLLAEDWNDVLSYKLYLEEPPAQHAASDRR
ncbi:MAE_28990/MAE_18760 family HEPN-like nuclease [Actinomyces ruminicola]|uniref:MAE_28990/MAE_18760 family HEPN-like nuclease n=1 Tax=Actinomyces ruminicola TaxID=332524 RepID=UPI0011C9FF5F|nr:MAE_28990/MAE_18760 family HEPN-like nuclease [Actinomyces ruminicola]